MTAPLPRLLDARGLMEEMGVKRGVAERLMQGCPKVVIGRRVFVDREDVQAEVERMKVTPIGFPLRKVS